MSARIIAIAHHAGGVGKTTTTLNLGHALARAGQRVLLVDLDPQGDLSDRLHLEPGGPTLRDALLHLSLPAIVPTEFGFDMIPASLESMADVEMLLVNAQRREERLRRVLPGRHYDYILLDCPPTLNLLTVNALYAADSLIIPVQAQPKAYRHLQSFLPMVAEVRANRDGEHPALLGLVLTMTTHTTNAREVETGLRATFGPAVFTATIPTRTALQSDSAWGAPLASYSPDCDGTRAYAALAQEVMSRAH